MRHKVSFFLAVLVALLATVAPFATAQSYPSTWAEISSQVITPTVSTALTVPTGTQWAQITVTVNPVHVSADGTAATTSDPPTPVGVYLTPTDKTLLENLRFLDTSAGPSTVYVRYFQKR